MGANISLDMTNDERYQVVSKACVEGLYVQESPPKNFKDRLVSVVLFVIIAYRSHAHVEWIER